MFRVNNKDTRTTLLPYFTPCSGVSIVNFEHVIVGWVVHLHIQPVNRNKLTKKNPERRIHNPVRHLSWTFLRKSLTAESHQLFSQKASS